MTNTSSQYAPIAHIPLIKSPTLRLPAPVELPPDIHPLPDNVNAYFVYPFTLEPHVITLESSRRSTLAAHTARREAYLQQRAERREKRRLDAIHRVAPGFNEGAVLVPVKRSSTVPAAAPGAIASLLDSENEMHAQGPKDVMVDLVEGLARMGNK